MLHQKTTYCRSFKNISDDTFKKINKIFSLCYVFDDVDDRVWSFN